MTDKSLLSAMQADLQAKNAEATRIASTFKVDEQGRFTVAAEQYADYQKVVNSAKEVKSRIDTMLEAEKLREFGEAPLGRSEGASDFGGERLSMEAKSLADSFVDSEAFQAAKSRGFGDQPHILAKMEGKSIFNFAAGTSTVQSLGQAQHLGIAEQARRKWHVRDLFPKSTTKAAVMYGVRETGWVNNAAQIAQMTQPDGSPRLGNDTDVFGRAPESKLELESVLYPVAEIKHHLNAHQNILSDEGRLKTFINTRMVEGVKYAEDRDLLHSVGGGEKITGLFNVPGVQQYTGLAADKYSVQVRRAITQALLAEYDPTGLVVSPAMFEQIETEEDNNGAFRVAVSVAIGAEKRIWRLNVVETTAMDNVNFLIGSFGLGAQLHDREQVSVKVSTEHASNFIDGGVTFLASERIALEVPRPESFVVGTWTA